MSDPTSDPTIDPGWPRGGALLWTLLPFTGFGMTRIVVGDGIVSLRQMFLKFASLGVWVGVVILLFVQPGGTLTRGWITAEVVVGIASVIGVVVLRNVRHLDCSNARALGVSYRARVLTSMPAAMAPLTFGFLFSVLADCRWIYALGMAFAAIAFVLAAPSAGDLRRGQARLAADGCTLSLVAAVRTP
jgi:hypothetical protein